MNRIFRCLLLLSAAWLLAVGTAVAQSVKTHKVKKGETIYGIAHANGISEAALRSANPGMERADYVLKKGDKIIIPTAGTASQAGQPTDADDVRQRAVRMAVMLPLHDNNGDGRRMVEYYRGLLMGCDSLRREGLSIDIYAWNTPDGADLTETLDKAREARPDVIFGPLYSRQMEPLAAFCQQQGAMLVIPFSIQAPQLATNSHLFQIYQAPDEQNPVTSRRFADWFKDSHPVIVDCDDPASTKGGFTAALRKELEARGTKYSLTSLKSADTQFASAFSLQQPNVVVLNSARSSDLDVVFVKLKSLVAAHAGVRVSLFGYPEWMAQAATHQANFHMFDTYIPSTYFQGLSPLLAGRLSQLYRNNFHQAMSSFMPPLAITGFDHALFFLRGLHKYGRTFDGAAGRFGYQPVQTPLKFERVGDGGYQNKAFMFVHYKNDGQIETLNY